MHISFAVFHDITLHLVDFPDQFPCQDLPWSSFGNDLAVFQYIQAVTEHGCNIQIMNGGDHSHIQLLYDLQKLQLMGNIQMVGWFIQNEAGCLLAAKSAIPTFSSASATMA